MNTFILVGLDRLLQKLASVVVTVAFEHHPRLLALQKAGHLEKLVAYDLQVQLCELHRSQVAFQLWEKKVRQDNGTRGCE